MKHVELCFLLHDTARLMRRQFEQRALGLGVTRAQWHLLWALSRQQGCNQTELADLLEIETITLCRMVDRLQTAGIVERRADPNDRRAWRLFLTDKAAPLLEKAEEIGEALAGEAVAHVDPALTAALVPALTQLRAGMAVRSPAENAA